MPFQSPRQTLIVLDYLAQRYGGRPSEWAEYDLSSIWFDMMCAHAAQLEEKRQHDIERAKSKQTRFR